jgi:hypothetical protein
MPRQIDLFPGNFKVTHDPNKRIGWNGQQLQNVPDPLTMIGEAIANLVTQVEHFLGIDMSSIDALFGPIISALTNGVGTVVGDIATWATNLFNLIQSIIDGIVNAITGTFDAVGAAVSDVVAHLFGQASTVQGHSALIAEIQSLLTPGVSASDQFVRSDSSGLGSNWSTNSRTGSGTIGVTGDMAAWYSSGASSNDSIASWIGANPVSNTDYQQVTMIVGTQCDTDLFGHTSYHDLYTRLDSTPTSYGSSSWIRARFQGKNGVGVGTNQVFIQCSIAGTISTIATVSLPSAPVAGTVFALFAGKKSSTAPAWIEVRMNGAPLYSAAHSSGSHYGSSYRGWGFGVATTGGVLIQIGPGRVALWTGQDQ